MKLIGKQVAHKKAATKDGKVQARIKYIDDTFFVKVGKRLIPIDEDCLSIFNCEFVYALPCNNMQKDWYKSKCNFENTSSEHISIISKQWSKYKPNMIVRGVIKDNLFII